MSDPKMTTSALAGWFGSNRILAETVGRKIGKCEHIVVPFAGGCCEVPYFDARTILINDAHRHIVNLARVVSNPSQCQQLQNHVDALLFHPDELTSAQAFCREVEMRATVGLFGISGRDQYTDPVLWAEAFFVSCWMARGGVAGTDGEFNGGLSIRYDAGGGDSNVRFRSAASSLAAWQKVLCGRCNFTCEDWREVLV